MTQKDIEDLIVYWMGNRVITDRQEVLDEISSIIGGEVIPGEVSSIYRQMVNNGRISDLEITGPDGVVHTTIKVLR